MEEVKNEEQAVVQPEGVEASSPEAETEVAEASETGTPQKPVNAEDDNRIPYERFKQVNDEKKQLLDLVLKLQQPVVQQAPMPTMDEYAHLTPEEQVFYRNLDARFEKKLEGKLKVKEEQFQKTLQAQQMVISNLLTRDFRRTHPEIKSGSPEEQKAAELIQKGYDPDDAAKLALFDKIQQAAQTKTKQTQIDKTQAKKQANVESVSTPPQNGLPPTKSSMRNFAYKLYDEEVKKGWE